VPFASCASANHQHAKRVFNPLTNPVGLPLHRPQPLNTALITQCHVLDRLRLGSALYVMLG
jgi:hypothetical protein